MLIRLFSACFCLLLISACGQDAAVEAPAEETTETPPASSAPPAAEPAGIPRQPAPPGAMAYIIEPADGAVVESPVRVLFGLSGAGVVPAGIEREGAGHHHLLIDTNLPDLGLPVPNDDTHRHFGGGQTEVEIELAPGTHTLQLLLGDHLHIPHEPPIMSERISIEVR